MASDCYHRSVWIILCDPNYMFKLSHRSRAMCSILYRSSVVLLLLNSFINKIWFRCIKEIFLKNNCKSGREEKKWDVGNEKPLLFIHAHISSLFMFWFHQSPGTSIIDEADLKVTTGYVFTSVYFLQPNTEICIFTTIYSFNKSWLCWAATSAERAPWRVDLFQSFVWFQLQSWEFDWLTGAEEIWGQCCPSYPRIMYIGW